MKLTKIDVAEAHLITAVRAHLRGEHPASVHLLAGSAREILTTIGEKTGTRTMLAGVAETTGTPLKQLVQNNRKSSFMIISFGPSQRQARKRSRPVDIRNHAEACGWQAPKIVIINNRLRECRRGLKREAS